MNEVRGSCRWENRHFNQEQAILSRYKQVMLGQDASLDRIAQRVHDHFESLPPHRKEDFRSNTTSMKACLDQIQPNLEEITTLTQSFFKARNNQLLIESQLSKLNKSRNIDQGIIKQLETGLEASKSNKKHFKRELQKKEAEKDELHIQMRKQLLLYAGVQRGERSQEFEDEFKNWSPHIEAVKDCISSVDELMEIVNKTNFELMLLFKKFHPKLFGISPPKASKKSKKKDPSITKLLLLVKLINRSEKFQQELLSIEKQIAAKETLAQQSWVNFYKLLNKSRSIKYEIRDLKEWSEDMEKKIADISKQRSELDEYKKLHYLRLTSLLDNDMLDDDLFRKIQKLIHRCGEIPKQWKDFVTQVKERKITLTLDGKYFEEKASATAKKNDEEAEMLELLRKLSKRMEESDERHREFMQQLEKESHKRNEEREATHQEWMRKHNEESRKRSEEREAAHQEWRKNIEESLKRSEEWEAATAKTIAEHREWVRKYIEESRKRNEEFMQQTEEESRKRSEEREAAHQEWMRKHNEESRKRSEEWEAATAKIIAEHEERMRKYSEKSEPSRPLEENRAVVETQVPENHDVEKTNTILSTGTHNAIVTEAPRIEEVSLIAVKEKPVKEVELKTETSTGPVKLNRTVSHSASSTHPSEKIFKANPKKFLLTRFWKAIKQASTRLTTVINSLFHKFVSKQPRKIEQAKKQ